MVVLKAERPGDARQRFEDVDDLVLDGGMGQLDVHPGGGDGAVYPHVFAVVELSLEGGQLVAARLDALEDLLEAAHVEFTLGVDLPQLVDDGEDVLLQRHLVVAVGQQDILGHRGLLQHLEVGFEPLAQPRLIFRQVLADGVAERQYLGGHLAAIVALPEELGLVGTVALGAAAPEHGTLDPEAVEDVGQLGGHAERVGQVTDLHRLAKAEAVAHPVEQVAQDGLAAHLHGVGLGVPGADDELARLHQRLHPGLVLGLDGKVILQHRGLTVQHIELVVRVGFKPRQDLRHVVDQQDAGLLGGEVPLPIPVHVRRDVNS